MNVHGSRLLRFGAFELDLESGELRKGGAPVKLQPQPFRVLALLAGHPGQLITRERIQQEIWSQDTYVDFEHGLNYCVRQIRAALDDDARSPRFIETLPRRGYRFLARVEELAGPPKPPAAEKTMLAVLPFDNLGGDPEQEYFSDGLTDEMITELGRISPERLGVIARTSAMRYKHTDKGIDEIGRELGVQYALEGSVRRGGNRVRITAQLIQVSDQTHLWAESYESDLRDILEVQSDVARAIASQIRIKLMPQEQARLARARPIDPEAYESYLKGRYVWNKRTAGELWKSIRCFEAAIERDPGCTVAYAGLADSYLTLLDYNELLPEEAMAHANSAVSKALDLDEALAEAHSALAHALLHAWNWSAAEREFKRAIDLNPSYATARFYYANYLVAVGRHEEALVEARLSQELDPVSAAADANAASVFYHSGLLQQAIEQCREALEMEPNFGRAHYDLGRAYLQTGAHARATAALEKAVALSGHSLRLVAALGHAYGVGGKRDKARNVLNELKQRSQERYVSASDVALVCLGLGNKDQALAWFERAYEHRDGSLIFLKVDPRLESLWPEPRFKDLLRRMNFPE